MPWTILLPFLLAHTLGVDVDCQYQQPFPPAYLGDGFCDNGAFTDLGIPVQPVFGCNVPSDQHPLFLDCARLNFDGKPGGPSDCPDPAYMVLAMTPAVYSSGGALPYVNLTLQQIQQKPPTLSQAVRFAFVPAGTSCGTNPTAGRTNYLANPTQMASHIVVSSPTTYELCFTMSCGYRWTKQPMVNLTVYPPQVCGDSIIEPGEACDTGNATDVGCYNCVVQPGYVCTGSPSVCSLALHCVNNIPLALNYGSSGVISEPNPMSATVKYNNLAKCAWQIDLPAGVIQIYFTALCLEPYDIALDDGDYVSVYDTSAAPSQALLYRQSSPDVGVLACGPVPPNITTVGPHARIEFASDNSLTYYGFSLTWTNVLTSPHCSGTVFTTSSNGTFSTQTPYWGSYHNNQTCSWVISLGSSGPFGRLMLNFTSFDLESGASGKTGDTVTIRDGTSATSPLLLTASGSTLPPGVVASGTDLRIDFTSDWSIVRSGFKFTYSLLAAQCVPVCGANQACFQGTCICDAGYYSDVSGCLLNTTYCTPYQMTNGNASTSCARSLGSVCSSFGCNSGYTLTGSSSATCTRDTFIIGHWVSTGTPPTCSPVDCGNPSNGTTASGKLPVRCRSGYTYGQSCDITCLSGFTLVTGPASIYCMANGQWSANTGICSDITPPLVVSSVPADGAATVGEISSCSITFDSQMDTSVPAFALWLIAASGDTQVAAVGTWSDFNTKFTLTLGQPLAADKSFQLKSSASARDANGVALATKTISFQTFKESLQILEATAPPVGSPGINIGLIVGVILGACCLLLLLALLIIYILKRRRKKRNQTVPTVTTEPASPGDKVNTFDPNATSDSFSRSEDGPIARVKPPLDESSRRPPVPIPAPVSRPQPGRPLEPVSFPSDE